MDKINIIIYRLVESGLVNKWEKDTKHVTRKEISEDLEPLSLYHLQTPFYVLLFGDVISLVVFIVEYVVPYILAKYN